MFKIEDNKIVSTVGIYYVEDNGFLFVKRCKENKYYPNQYALVGGKVEEHEHNVAALYRETKEEVGILPDWIHPKVYAIRENEDFKIYFYVGYISQSKIKDIELSSEHSSYKFFNSFEYNNIAPITKEVVRDYCVNEFYLFNPVTSHSYIESMPEFRYLRYCVGDEKLVELVEEYTLLSEPNKAAFLNYWTDFNYRRIMNIA